MFTNVNKKENRLHRHKRVRTRVSGSLDLPRISIFRSNRYLYAQAINDKQGETLFSARGGKTVKEAKELGTVLAGKAKEKKIKAVVFDRGGYRYHGRIKALAEAIREGGITI